LREAMKSGQTLAGAITRLRELGLDWERVLAAEAPCHGPNGEIDRIVVAIERSVLPQFVRRANALRWAAVEQEARVTHARFLDLAASHPASALLPELERAAATLDP